MQVTVLAVGKAGRGPEDALCGRYADRIRALGRRVGVRSFALRELADGAGPARADDETARILASHSTGLLVALDEGGDDLTSATFARTLEGWCGAGHDLTFAIGGADGHGAAMAAAADRFLSLSRLTLPHLLARVVLFEQIYRAVTILVGHPYHRAERPGDERAAGRRPGP